MAKTTDSPIDPPPNVLESLIQRFDSGDYTFVTRESSNLLSTYPSSIRLLNILGAALKNLGKLEQALAVQEKAISESPNSHASYSNRGTTLMRLGRIQEAASDFEKAIQLSPGFSAAFSNLGNAYRKLGNYDKAISCFKKAIELEPSNADTFFNLGGVYRDLERPEQALSCYENALGLDPGHSGAHFNLGLTLKELGRYREAIASYGHAIKTRENFAAAYSNMGSAYKELGLLEQAIESYSKAIKLNPYLLPAYNNLVMVLNYCPGINQSESLACAKAFGEVVEKFKKFRFIHHIPKIEEKVLRIGIVSGDLCNHPVGYFLENVLFNIDADKIQLHAYPTMAKEDELTKRLKPLFVKWRPLHSMSDFDAANMIYSDAIDILLDLSGHTANNRLTVFAYKPAPLQIAWLGYFGTTGLKEMDYILGDTYVTPPGSDNFYTEHVWRLSDTRWCFTPPDVEIPVSQLPALNNGYVTFGCFSNLTKLNDQVLALWSRLLHSIEDSRLILKAQQYQDGETSEQLHQWFVKKGIEAHRVIVEGPEKRIDYFRAYYRVDITLDPFPFTGGTTSLESLWMGVPFITIAGESLISRQGLAILENASLPNWIAKDEAEYLQKAKEFASDFCALAETRNELRNQVLNSPLFDAKTFSNNFVDALFGMWEEYRKGRKQSFLENENC